MRVIATMLCVLLFGAVTGCAQKQRAEISFAPDKQWEVFQKNRQKVPDTHFRAKASLNYADNEKSHRMLLELWGSPSLPLRMDVTTSFGSIIAMLSKTAELWQAYIPEDQILLQSKDPWLGQQALGIDIAMSLQELAGIFLGNYTGVIPTNYIQTVQRENGDWQYFFSEHNVISSAVLNHAAQPVELSGLLYGEAIKVNLFYANDAEPGPVKKIIMTTEPATEAIFSVKKITFLQKPFQEKAFSLDVPQNTGIHRIGKGF